MYICIYSKILCIYIYSTCFYLKKMHKNVSSTFWGGTVSHCMIISIYPLYTIYPIKWLVSSQCLMGNIIRMIVITIIIRIIIIIILITGVASHPFAPSRYQSAPPTACIRLGKQWRENDVMCVCVSPKNSRDSQSGNFVWEMTLSTIGSESRPMLFRQTQVWLRPLDLWLLFPWTMRMSTFPIWIFYDTFHAYPQF